MTDSFCRTILNRITGHLSSSLRSVCSVFTAFLLLLRVIAFPTSVLHTSVICPSCVLSVGSGMVWELGVRFPNAPRLTQFNIDIFILNNDYSTRFTDYYLREVTLSMHMFFSDNTLTSYLFFHKRLRTGKRQLLFYEMLIVCIFFYYKKMIFRVVKRTSKGNNSAN